MNISFLQAFNTPQHSGQKTSQSGDKRSFTAFNSIFGKIKSAGILLFFLYIWSSCGAYKNIPYFKDLRRDSAIVESVNNFSPITIQPADILGIDVNSRNPESSSIFNRPVQMSTNSNMVNPAVGYLVDQNGYVQLPLIGNYKVSGQTSSEIREKLTEKLLTFYKDPVVNIRILNFKVGVFGDVMRPDVYTFQNERVTITQALTLAGDLNITAMRNNITLVREENGKRVFIPIDLTSKKVFESPYYYLRNNDEIYVQPDRTKYATVDRGYRITSLVLSGLSIIAIVLSNLYR
ncbi:polysaccharide biosynthesis/export family protein [Dyadobacter luticola]|uniref:Polysaccharide export protein n=1 Tax=Dyadobacter luticola TaxID=1979387 RepID=A0A5R9L5I6_9BACT|nr:polysaccharide biosynthesis/export family protein [Dyadobacter luticola]TLV03708.1 polysaccharide export protein [Dyadobacter luticola]